jgi:iron complex transport system permease protein
MEASTLVHKAGKTRQFLLAGGFLALLLLLLSMSIGAFQIPLPKIPLVFLQALGWDMQGVEAREVNVLMHIRLPRVVLAALVGGGLGLAGAALQGLFRNPLVEPGLIGVSSGAALFAVAFLVFGAGLPVWGDALRMPGLTLAAFAGGAINTLLVYKLAGLRGKASISMLILAGIALNALCGALIGLVIFYADDTALRNFTFWSLGDVGGATWPKVGITALATLPAMFLLVRQHRALDALALGEAEAFHMGVEVDKLKYVVIIGTALIVGVGVSLTGTIGFVGLIVPHLTRMILGAGHKAVLPGSFLLGMILLTLSDLLARTVIAPAEIPIGIITAIIGAPFFIWLISNLKR